MDDVTYLENNLTITFEYTPVEDVVIAYPIIRITELFGKNFSAIFPNCY